MGIYFSSLEFLIEAGNATIGHKGGEGHLNDNEYKSAINFTSGAIARMLAAGKIKTHSFTDIHTCYS